MSQQEKSSGRVRISGPVAGVVLALFTALTVGVAQSQIAVDAAPWAEAVVEAARQIISPSPALPTAMPLGAPQAPRSNYRPEDVERRTPQAPTVELPAPPVAVEPIPLTPWGPLPARDRRSGAPDAGQMCSAGCQEDVSAALALCGSYRSEGTIGRGTESDPRCRVKLRATYLSCMASCGFTQLPESGRGDLPDRAEVGPAGRGVAP